MERPKFRIQRAFEKFRCDHSKLCAAVHITVLIVFLMTMSGLFGYYMHGFIDDSKNDMLARKYTDAIAGREDRIKKLESLTTQLSVAAEKTTKAANKADKAATDLNDITDIKKASIESVSRDDGKPVQLAPKKTGH